MKQLNGIQPSFILIITPVFLEHPIAAKTFNDTPTCSNIFGKETGHWVNSPFKKKITYCITLKAILFSTDSFGCEAVVIFESYNQASVEVMSIIINPEDFWDLLNQTIHTNDTLVVNPKTLSCQIKPDPTVAVTLCLILIVIFLLAIPGNLLVVLVIGTSKQALTPSNVYLFHLTIADGLMALTLPFWAIALIQGWIFGDFMCKFLNLVIEANFYTSILFLACISIDRYLVIVHASESLRSRQRMGSWLLCAAVWAFGWALALPALFNDVSKRDSESERMTCSENFDIGSASTWRLATRVFRHIFGFFLPLGVMITCYSITIARLLHTRGFQKHRAMKLHQPCPLCLCGREVQEKNAAASAKESQTGEDGQQVNISDLRRQQNCSLKPQWTF
ncbi:C-X-C chemokine receptor type 2-like isoform X2 [Siniperca chuatsi]|uniref:C-X-C chemokine receptor type 2-like isoform X2 n=1 Tax=Siniperca chuatsi TaxID=119488 RepID=UPI001CE03DC9|nr:C-X-C chemokine receptor type 2-like isoform X2 [Siniperca chuatsi]